MRIQTVMEDGVTRVKVIGAIDNYTYPIFAKEINILSRVGVDRLHIDFSECRQVNLSTIKLLDKVQANLEKENKKIIIESFDGDEAELLMLMEKKRKSQSEKN